MRVTRSRSAAYEVAIRSECEEAAERPELGRKRVALADRTNENKVSREVRGKTARAPVKPPTAEARVTRSQAQNAKDLTEPACPQRRTSFPAGLASGCSAAVHGFESMTIESDDGISDLTNVRLEMDRSPTGTATPAACIQYRDIDAVYEDNPKYCVQYVNDIYQHYLALEKQFMPRPDYMAHVQRDVNAQMRAILVDWLVEVAEEYDLRRDTLHLSVSYIDSFLSRVPVVRAQLQLVGICCMFLAAKYEEVFPPHLADFVYITDNTYTREEVLSMEKQILQTLAFTLAHPTIVTFLKRYINAAVSPQDSRVICHAWFLADLTLGDYRMVKHLPSTIAASCIFLSLYTLERAPWTGTLQHYTSLSPPDLFECVTDIHAVHFDYLNSNLPAVREKHASTAAKEVSLIPMPATLPGRIFSPLTV
eukprot:jgi/Mesvir1/10201/Mv18326-RA.1